MFVANWTSSDLSAYRIDQDTGALTGLLGSPFPSGQHPRAVTIDPTGRFLYTADWGSATISAWALDPLAGGLVPIDGSPFPSRAKPSEYSVY